jgi:flagellar hook-associated protein 2
MASVNNTSTSSTSSTISNGRYWGLASGLDVDSIVSGLITKQQSKIDKVMQQQQQLQWKQSAYRDIIQKLNDFENAYLKVGPSTSMAYNDMYTAFKATNSNSTLLTVSANSDANGLAQVVTIKQSATTAVLSGSKVGGDITGSMNLADSLDLLKSYAATAKGLGDAAPSFNVTVDGLTKNISFSSDELNAMSSGDDFVSKFNEKLASAFGKVTPASGSGDAVCKVAASSVNGKLVLSSQGGYTSTVGITSAATTFDVRMLGEYTKTSPPPTMSVTFGDSTKTLTFSSSDDLSSTDKILANINAQLATDFPSSGLTATIGSDGKLSIKDGTGTDAKEATISTSDISSKPLSALGITSGQSNRLNVNTTSLSQLSGLTTTRDADGYIHANINGTDIKLGTDNTTVAAAFAAINNSNAGVKISYDSTTDSITMMATQSGSSGKVDLTGDTSGFFGALKITDTLDSGDDAIINIKSNGSSTGTDYTRSSNTFTISGVTYTINSAVTPSDAQTVNLTFQQDSTKLKDGINSFISAYNTLLDALHAQTTTQADKDYPPLTDAQKTSMTQDQIDDWNKKAQQGMLYNDSTLQSLADSIRSALYKTVTTADGNNISLYSIGVTTSDDYADYGKLEIKPEDEAKFENALSTNAEQIKELFTKSSNIIYDINPTTPDEIKAQQNRKSEEGLVDNLNDLISGVAGTTGTKGSLLQIAGIIGDSTQYDNQIFDQLKDINSTITTLKAQLEDKKTFYYNEFSQLESFMSQANSQSSIISSMMGNS